MNGDEPATDTLRAIRFQEYGEPGDVLNLQTVPVPDPGPGQLRVAVQACGLAPADWALCRGLFPRRPPRGIGCDVSGQGVDDPDHRDHDGPCWNRTRELGSETASPTSPLEITYLNLIYVLLGLGRDSSRYWTRRFGQSL
jgi:hypothetical protein